MTPFLKSLIKFLVFKITDLLRIYSFDELDFLSGKETGKLKSIYIAEKNQRILRAAKNNLSWSSAAIWRGASGISFYTTGHHDCGLDFLLNFDNCYRTPLLNYIINTYTFNGFKSVIDCGCGLGHCSAYLRLKLPINVSITAFDPCPLAVSKAIKTYEDYGINFVVDEISPVSFQFKVNTVYLFCMVLMYFSPVQINALSNLAKNTPGTILAIIEPLPVDSNLYSNVHSLSSFYHDIDRVFSADLFNRLYVKNFNGSKLGNPSGIGVKHRVYQSKF